MNKEDVCFAYILVSQEKFDDYDQWSDRWGRLKELRKVIAATFCQPEEKIEKILENLNVSNMNCRELAEIIKKGCER